MIARRPPGGGSSGATSIKVAGFSKSSKSELVAGSVGIRN